MGLVEPHRESFIRLFHRERFDFDELAIPEPMRNFDGGHYDAALHRQFGWQPRQGGGRVLLLQLVEGVD